MTWKRLTALVIVIAVVGLALYDLIAYAFGGNDATISVTVLRTSEAFYGFALYFMFGLGVLCGHLFLPQRVPSKP